MLSIFRIIGIGVVCALLFVEIPAPALKIILGLAMALAVILLFFTFSKRRFAFFPSFLLFFTFFSVGMGVAFSRVSVVGLIEEEYVPLVLSLSDVICQGNFVNGIITGVVLLLGLAYSVKYTACSVSEKAAKFALDDMSYKFFCVDSKLNDGKISQAEVDAERKKIRMEANYYSSLDGFAKFLLGITMVISLFCVVFFSVAVAIQILIYSTAYLQAVDNATKVFSSCVVFFSIPVMFISICFRISIRHDWPLAG